MKNNMVALAHIVLALYGESFGRASLPFSFALDFCISLPPMLILPVDVA